MFRVCVTLFVITVSVPDKCLSECPSGWLTRESLCYFGFNGETAWTEAESFCQQYGGHLTSIADIDERVYLYDNFISGSGEKWWIGLNDLASEGNYVWTDGTQLNFQVPSWGRGEPNNDGDEDCICINGEGEWQDNMCRKKRRFICKTSDTPVPDCDETNGFTKHGSYCYKYIAEQYSWSEAANICENGWNAELTAITSDDEQTYVLSLMTTGNVDTWIGLSDTTTPGTLRWSNGHDPFTDSSYNNWAPNEPITTNPGTNCVQSSIALSGQWNVAQCEGLKPFICRKGLRAVCPDGWTYGHGKCYEIVMNQNSFLTWTEAHSYCIAKNARLLQIETEEQQTFITSFASALSKEGILQVWLGISDIGHDNTLTWADQDPITFEHWDNTPNPREGQDDCAQVYLGKGQDNWELVECYSHQAFLCEINEGTPLSDIKPPDEIFWICPNGYKLLPPYCYLFSTDQLAWLEADQYCNDADPDGKAHLTSIHNSEEQSFISGHLRQEAWIGLSDRDIQGKYSWTDSTPYNFTNWNKGEPNHAAAGENCVLLTKTGTWNDDPCSRSYSYVCRKNAVYTNTPRPIPTVPTGANEILCGSGYLHSPSNHKCYKIVDDLWRSWADARIHCQTEGGDLASINSPDEQAFIQANIALSIQQVALWIGGYDTAPEPDVPQVDITDGGWAWIDGSPFNYVNWNSGEPNNVNNEDCIEMVVEHGYWNDLSCNDFRGFVCERGDPDHTTEPPATDCKGVDCCYRHLGVEKGGSVKDNQLSASSQRDQSSGADRGRLNTHDQYLAFPGIGPGTGGWIPLQNQPEPQWIQVNLKEFYEVRGVITQGLNGISQPVNQNMWTREIKVSYKTHPDKDIWEPIRDSDGNEIVFSANHDQNTQVTNIFPRPVFATGIRIYTITCRLGCALRFELIGCSPQCVDSLGVATDGPGGFPVLPVTSFTASSSLPGYEPENARLDYSERAGSASKCWKPSANDNNQWLQVDLGEIRKISGILLQGNPQVNEYVTEYKVQFSGDGSSFTTYLDSASNEQIFPGNAQPNDISEGFFREPLTTRFIRILPQTWFAAIAVRFDVIGCNSEDLVTCRDTAESYDATFSVDCPAGCDSATDQLYGTSVYSENSYICAAAIHDGRFLADHGGTVDVKKIDGKSSYTGSTQHGITSKDAGPSDKAFIFQGDHLGCPPGWDGWSDWCYYTPRMSVGLSWPDAGSYCQQQGADLVSIHSQAEQDFVTTLVLYEYAIGEAWIGFNDLNSYNYFQWSDGSDVTFTKWDVNEPNSEDERCVEMYKITGLWNDQNCDDALNVICKMDKIPVNQDQTSIDGCESGWIGFEGSCYFIDLTRMVWVNSEDYCKGVGGHLVAVNNIEENMWLTSKIAEATHSSDDEKFWIGLGAYLDPNSESLIYSWSTGEPVTFTAWESDQPDIRHTCSFPFLYEGIEYYTCIDIGLPAKILNGPWCSADPVFTNHFVGCDSWTEGQVGCFRMDSVTGLWSQGQPIACGSDAYKICEKPRIGYTNPVLPTTTHPYGNCPDGYYGVPSSSYCYQINEKQPHERLNWEDANTHCTSQGAQFVSIHSSQEEANIISGVSHTSGSDLFWIGLRRTQSGVYGWSDNSPLMYTNWATGEPNNFDGREECARAYYGDDNGSWNDINCDATSNWICKVLRGASLQQPVTPPQGTYSPHICGYDVDWVAYSPSNGLEYCYHFSSEIKGFYEAGVQCRSLGGDLVSVHSSDEQAFLTGRTSKTTIDNYWTGLVQESYGGYYIWSDGSTLVYTNWRGGEPNDYNGQQESCVAIESYDGLWWDANCGKTYAYICKKLVGATPGPPKPTPTLSGGCPPGWKLYGSKCFLPVGWTDTSMRKTWNDAESYCNEQKGFLTSVPNQYYNAFLVSLMYQLHSSAWIGLNTIGNNRVFLWSDNEAVTYTNWESNEPNAQGNEDCVEMYTSGRWNDKECSTVKPFICNMWRSTSYSEPSPDETGCPSGYTSWDTSCYKLHYADVEQLSWTDARAECQAAGASLGMTMDLVSIWNWYENAFLVSLFWPDSDYDYTWIGLYSNHSEANGETQYTWSDGSALYYTNWETNEPHEIGSDFGCGEMRNHGTWSVVTSKGLGSDVSCNTKRPFVCKHETLVMPTGDPGLGSCDTDWVALGDYCYLVRPGFNSADQLSFGDAELACNKRYGSLVSIHSDIENKAVDQWAGSSDVWLGLKRNAWGGWEWTDSSPVDFTNWKNGEPNDVGETGEQCTEMYQSGNWNDNLCRNLRGFICKKHKSYSYCSFPSTDRVDCGFDGINEYECLERGCCWDSSGVAEITCYYSRKDAACLEKGGQCKDYVHNVCELGYEQGLCSMGSDNRCCFTCDPDDSTCNEQVDSWEEGDGQCTTELSGKCQYNSNYCNGQYYSGYCGGPGPRQCCSSKGQTTTKSPATPKDTTTKNIGGETKVTTTPGGEVTTKKPSTNPKTTDFRITEPSGGGLSGGAIAGIVITVVMLLAGAGTAFYFYKQGNMTSFSMGAFAKKPDYGTPTGFDNPIIYSKDASEEDSLGLPDLRGDSSA